MPGPAIHVRQWRGACYNERKGEALKSAIKHYEERKASQYKSYQLSTLRSILLWRGPRLRWGTDVGLVRGISVVGVQPRRRRDRPRHRVVVILRGWRRHHLMRILRRRLAWWCRDRNQLIRRAVLRGVHLLLLVVRRRAGATVVRRVLSRRARHWMFPALCTTTAGRRGRRTQRLQVDGDGLPVGPHVLVALAHQLGIV